LKHNNQAAFAILEKGKLRVQSILEPAMGSEAWTGEVHVLVDKVQQSGKDSIVKAVMMVGTRGGNSARTQSIQMREDDPTLSELIQLQLVESSVFRLGERVPLCEVGDQQFEVIVQ
jgi:hypothetical protein